MTVLARTGGWNDAAALTELHVCRSTNELDERFAAELARTLPGVGVAICLHEGAEGRVRVACTLGDGLPLARGQQFASDAVPVPVDRLLSIDYQGHQIGFAFFGRELDADHRTIATAALAHYGTALANLTLDEESRQATASFCASLQVLEEGIVLFQEGDSEAVAARLLNLATAMGHATAGALYVLREVGNAESGLVLEQTLGIPEAMLAGLRSRDGTPWPAALVGDCAQFAEVAADGSLALLAAECLPPMLHNIVVLPLRYHGVEAGLCVLFNAAPDGASIADYLGRLQSLGQLGAALLHRLRLEAISAVNRSRERELQIASQIQKRLLPTTMPATSEFDVAWSSIAAQSIGGDYIDLFSGVRRDLCAVVADASGHGINSALLMTSFRSTYRANAPWMDTDELSAWMNNEVVSEVGPTGMFITAALLHIDRESRRVRVTSAGHCPLMVYRSAANTVERIDSHGPPFGFIEGAEYEHYETAVGVGDVLLLYTDGITEAADAELDMFGEDRLADLLAQHAGDAATSIVDTIKAELARFTGRTTYDDDVSVMVVRVM